MTEETPKYIYESPDKGKTVYRREFGKLDRELVKENTENQKELNNDCLLYTSPSPRDLSTSRMPSSA